MRGFAKPHGRALWLATFCLVSSLIAPGLAAGQEFVPLRGSFEGAGTTFAGNFTQLGGFDGVIDPATFTAVWTAPNGDTVTNQTTSFILIDPVSPGVFTYEQTLVLTGGTGRFANATGGAIVRGVIDFNTGAFDGDLEGIISRPGSRR